MRFEEVGTPIHPSCQRLKGSYCELCERLDPSHGHLNKVAHLCSEFATAMFPEGPDRETAREWGFLTGLWHDLGKFAPEWRQSNNFSIRSN